MKRPLLLTLLTALAVVAFVTAFAFVSPALGAPAAQEAKPVIAQPGEGAAVREVVQIIGTATHPQFQRYELYYAPYPVPSDQSWIFIGDAHNNQQPLGLLGTWDSRSVPDGSYALRVRVVKLDSNYIDSDPRRVIVANTGPVDTPTPEVSPTPEEPLPELPPTESPVDAAPVIEAPTGAPVEGAMVPTIAPTPTPGATISAAGAETSAATPTPPRTAVIASSGAATSGASSSLEESAASIANQLFSGSRLADTAKKAAMYTAGAFLVAGLFFGVKGILVWLWYKIKP
jgi:hypothetical protein